MLLVIIKHTGNNWQIGVDAHVRTHTNNRTNADHIKYKHIRMHVQVTTERDIFH